MYMVGGETYLTSSKATDQMRKLIPLKHGGTLRNVIRKECNWDSRTIGKILVE